MDASLRCELASIIEFKLDPLDSKNNSAFLDCLVNVCKRKPDAQANARPLPINFVRKLLYFSLAYHEDLPNVVRVNRAHIRIKGSVSRGDLTIVGDLHGQYDDFAQIFQNPKLGGFPLAKKQFIFNGDMVDRGSMGVEIMIVLMFCNLLYPHSVHILRGNHETRRMTEKYGFKQEVEAKYHPKLYNDFMTFFDALPIAAIVDDTVFVTHGGIGTAVMSLSIEDINRVNRFSEIVPNGVAWDLLWADPEPQAYQQSTATHRPSFAQIDTEAFLKRNKLSLLIRSHEYQESGFYVCHNNHCWTVFSAPNYCDTFGNTGAIVKFVQLDTLTANIIKFHAANSVSPGVCNSFCVEAPENDDDEATEIDECDEYSDDFELD